MQFIRSATAWSLTALALAACGGTGNSTDNPDTQSKQLAREAKSAASTYQTAVESLYVAYFGRPADPNGLANFAAALQAAGAPTDVPGLAAAYATNPAVKSLIDSFGTSAESQKLYGGGSTTDFVDAVFQNVLGRAPQASGLSFWVSSIDSGAVSPGDAALAIMSGALTNTTAQGKLDTQLIDNRLAAAGYFTGAASADTYTGATAASDARAMLATVTATTSASSFQSTAVAEAQTINNQTIFESTALHGGEWYVYDNIPYGGGILVPGTNYVYGEVINSLSESPSDGAQLANTYFTTLDTALSTPGSGVTRILVGGQVLLRPVTGLRSVSYVGDAIQVQYYDTTGQTVLNTSQFDNYQTGTLSGQMSLAPEIVQASVPINQWVTYQNFSGSANWQNGSAYVTHQAHNVGNIYALSDCLNVASPTYTYGNSPTPCVSNTSLTADIFPIAQYSGDINKPFEIDNASDGSFVTVQGLPMWIANNPRPLEEAGANSVYRIYVQMNGNIYYGAMTADGATIYTQQADGSYVNYTLALNQTGANSVSQGLITGSGQGSKVGIAAAVSNTADMFGIGGTGVSGSLSPANLRTHYNVPPTLTGAGQTVAIIDAPSSADVAADLTTYSTYYNLPACTTANGCFQQYTFTPPADSTVDWGSEPDLDVQMVHAIAPNAKIVLITAASDSVDDLFAAAHYALTLPGVTSVSMSFGGSGYTSQSQSDFFNAATTGGPVAFASSGDGGYDVAPQYPAVDPWVVGVGGTRVNSVQWSSGASDWGWQFSGGGTGTSWQGSTWMTSVQPQNIVGGRRGVPDVSAVSDFQNSAVSMYYDDRWILEGGTSAASPLWAGIAALFGESVGANNQSLLSKLGNPSGGFGEILYQMAANSNSANLFFRSTAGSNDLIGAYCPLCTATGTYNEVTGLGSPNVANMVAYLGGTVPATTAIDNLGKPQYKMQRNRTIQQHALIHRQPTSQGY